MDVMHLLMTVILFAANLFTRTGSAFIRGEQCFYRVIVHGIARQHRAQIHQSTTSNSSDDDGSVYRKYYSITGIGQRNAVTMNTITGHQLKTDVPKKMGGSDTAPQPLEHLLAALVGCTQAPAVYVGRMMQPRLIIDSIDFDVKGYRDERGALSLPIDVLPAIPARLQSVSGTVTVHFKKGIDVNDEQLKVLGEQTEVRCPVANMMHMSGCKMKMTWVNGGTST